MEECIVILTSVLIVVISGVVRGGDDVCRDVLIGDVGYEGLVLHEDVVIFEGGISVVEFGHGDHLLRVVYVETVYIETLQTEVGLVENSEVLFDSLDWQVGRCDEEDDVVHFVWFVGERIAFFGSRSLVCIWHASV